MLLARILAAMELCLIPLDPIARLVCFRYVVWIPTYRCMGAAKGQHHFGFFLCPSWRRSRRLHGVVALA